MKRYKFDEEEEIDFLILGINSHVRPYKLCWEINKELNTNFVKTQNHRPQNKSKQSFERFRFKDENTQTRYNILTNRSSFGYLDSHNKSVNYFLIVQDGIYNSKKLIKSLSKIDDVLLVFELNLSKIKSITPFIIND